MPYYADFFDDESLADRRGTRMVGQNKASSGCPFLRRRELRALNNDYILPPQPSFSTTSTSSFFPSLLSRAILSVFLSVFSRLSKISGWGRPLFLPQLHGVDAATYREDQEGLPPADEYHHSLPSPLAPSDLPSYNEPPCEAPMSFAIRPYRRFPVQCSVTYHAMPFLKLPLASCSGFGSMSIPCWDVGRSPVKRVA